MYERSYPNGGLQIESFQQAFKTRQKLIGARTKSIQANPWIPLGPQNVGGRTLTMAFHPEDPDTIFIGSASGGLWKTTTAGLGNPSEAGSPAWTMVDTGFPILGVAALAIDPTNPDNIYIGTGEVYNTFQVSEPGTVNRFTRGTYGIGILKSTDGGDSWSKSLDFQTDELKGVQDIEINPTNGNIIFAATTDGLLRSTDAGANWDVVNAIPLAVEIEINPVNPDTIFVTHGNLTFPGTTVESGIYRSTDGGDTFTALGNGLPTSYSGKAEIAISSSNPNVIYASVQEFFIGSGEATTPLGLYKSTDGGDNWIQINNENVAKFQGWYSHDVEVNPENEDEIIYVGIDTWRSIDGGVTLEKRSSWEKWFFGKIELGAPEGPEDYVHADIHDILYHPEDPNTFYLATDGGIFVSNDGGDTFEGRNVGYQTTQFFADFSNSRTNPDIAMGGTQDNASYIYDGTPAWIRVIGGDGMSAAVHPTNDQIMYGSAQGLLIARSGDRFNTDLTFISPPRSDAAAFSAPYVLSQTDPDILYAGSQSMFKSTDEGATWTNVSNGPIDGTNVIRKIGLDPFNNDRLLASTASDPFTGTSAPKVLRSTDGGQTWSQSSGLPDRVATDFAYSPLTGRIAYVTLSGFGSGHVFKTENNGGLWTDISNNLPDVPTNSVLVDPFDPEIIYVANDLGVYVSIDGGSNWEPMEDGLPSATLAVDLSLSLANNRIRVATHGNGVYETDLLGDSNNVITSIDNEDNNLDAFSIYPNPFVERVNFKIDVRQQEAVSLEIYTMDGRLVDEVIKNRVYSRGQHILTWAPESSINSVNGTFTVKLVVGKEVLTYRIVKAE